MDVISLGDIQQTSDVRCEQLLDFYACLDQIIIKKCNSETLIFLNDIISNYGCTVKTSLTETGL